VTLQKRKSARKSKSKEGFNGTFSRAKWGFSTEELGKHGVPGDYKKEELNRLAMRQTSESSRKEGRGYRNFEQKKVGGGCR